MKKILLIEANRTCYSTRRLQGTLTVGDLLDLLSEYDEDTPIAISNDRGYTYGKIEWDSIREEPIDSEEDYE